MAKEIVWSEKSIKYFEEIYKYLENKWGLGSALKFKDTVFFKLDLISQQP